MITEKRLARFKSVAANRQSMCILLENVHDPHNIGAVLRTCDSVGIQNAYILITDKRLDKERILNNLNATATGVSKWLHVHIFDDLEKCFAEIKSLYDTLLATHLNEASISLYATPLTGKIAFLFGNEHEGLTKEALAQADGNINIPQFGMVGSLNISVACAITLYEACRQRIAQGAYELTDELELSDAQEAINQHYVAQHNKRYER